MTKLQVIFLLVAMLYLVAKVILGFIIYLVTLQIEAAALERNRRRREYLQRVRERERELYREAYQLYQKRYGEQPAVVRLPEPEARENRPPTGRTVQKPVTRETKGTSGREKLQEVLEF